MAHFVPLPNVVLLLPLLLLPPKVPLRPDSMLGIKDLTATVARHGPIRVRQATQGRKVVPEHVHGGSGCGDDGVWLPCAFD